MYLSDERVSVVELLEPNGGHALVVAGDVVVGVVHGHGVHGEPVDDAHWLVLRVREDVQLHERLVRVVLVPEGKTKVLEKGTFI